MAGDHEQVFVIRERRDVVNFGDLFIFFERRNAVDEVRAASGTSGRFRNIVGDQSVNATGGGKEEQRVVRRCREHFGDKVVIFCLDARDAGAAFTLRTVSIRMHAFNISLLRKRDDHRFVGDQIQIVQTGFIADNFTATFFREALLDVEQFFFDDLHDFGFVTQKAEQVFNPFFQVLIFRFEFFKFESGQATQAHVENRKRLFFGQSEVFHQRVFRDLIGFGARARSSSY